MDNCPHCGHKLQDDDAEFEARLAQQPADGIDRTALGHLNDGPRSNQNKEDTENDILLFL